MKVTWFLFAMFLSLSLKGLFLFMLVILIIKGGFMKNLKRRLLAVVLSLALVFSVTVPSFAATVNSDGQNEVVAKTSPQAIDSNIV